MQKNLNCNLAFTHGDSCYLLYFVLVITIPFPMYVIAGDRFDSVFWNLHMSNIKEDEQNDRLKRHYWLRLVLLCEAPQEASFSDIQGLAINKNVVTARWILGVLKPQVQNV